MARAIFCAAFHQHYCHCRQRCHQCCHPLCHHHHCCYCCHHRCCCRCCHRCCRQRCRHRHCCHYHYCRHHRRCHCHRYAVVTAVVTAFSIIVLIVTAPPAIMLLLLLPLRPLPLPLLPLPLPPPSPLPPSPLPPKPSSPPLPRQGTILLSIFWHVLIGPPKQGNQQRQPWTTVGCLQRTRGEWQQHKLIALLPYSRRFMAKPLGVGQQWLILLCVVCMCYYILSGCS